MSAVSEPVEQSGHGLSARDAHILDFERHWWRHVGAKDQAIRSEFDLSVARYYQILNSVIDLPDALRYDPILVGRLQRARDARTIARVARAFRIAGPSESPQTQELNG